MGPPLEEIEWDEPILPVVADAAWESRVKRAMGMVTDLYRRISPSPWLGMACLGVDTYRVRAMPADFLDRCGFVVAQENSCRYCYGATRAILRIQGYPERAIERMEYESRMGELEPRERAFLEFCRNLSRSKPRPARAELQGLIEQGFDAAAVREMAFMIAMRGFYNRVTTFLACEPALKMERFSESVPGRLLGLAGPLTLRPLLNFRRSTSKTEGGEEMPPGAPFGTLIQSLRGLPAASWLRGVLESALASPVLPQRTKLLMFAVVAKALDCAFCQDEAKAQLASKQVDEAMYDEILASLGAPALEPHDALLLTWTRDTVHYHPLTIQRRTRELREQLDDNTLLEAIGVASLANATVRLAMLVE